MAQNEALVIHTLRGGQNDTDPSIELPSDQGTSMRNVEFTNSTCGERRLGHDAIDLTGAGTLATRDKCTFLHRGLPSNVESDTQLWALTLTGTSAASLSYKDTTWHSVTVSDTPTLTGAYPYLWQAANAHGKTFFGYKSNVSRLHVWDGTSMRRVGIAPASAAPTGADSGGAGSYTGTRYARVRFVKVTGSLVDVRSEPSPVLTISPSGTDASFTITRPTAPGDSETHWEIELSVDNSFFYRMSRIAVGTTTYVDSAALNSGYSSGTESEDVGDYEVPTSAEFLVVDEDRVVMGGDHDDSSKASRISWSPVNGDPGDGNDERIPTDTDNFLDLNGFEGGPLTHLHGAVNGFLWAFKRTHLYKLVRTGKRDRAYDALAISKRRGALKGSVVEAIDQYGKPALYFLDQVGIPCRIGQEGIQTCGKDIQATTDTINLDATVVSRCVYYPRKGQIHWCVATGDALFPDLRLVLHVAEQVTQDGQVRKGWTVWDGDAAEPLAMCLFGDNIDDGTARSLELVPFMGMVGGGLIWRGDTGHTDNGTDYSAHVRTKDFPAQNVTWLFGVRRGALVGLAASANLSVSLIKNFGVETKVAENVSMAASGSETSVVVNMDDLGIAELSTAAMKVSDATNPSAVRWELSQLILKLRPERNT